MEKRGEGEEEGYESESLERFQSLVRLLFCLVISLFRYFLFFSFVFLFNLQNYSVVIFKFPTFYKWII